MIGGNHERVEAELSREHLTLRFPCDPASEQIDVDFTTSDGNFKRIKRMLGIILPMSLVSLS